MNFIKKALPAFDREKLRFIFIEQKFFKINLQYFLRFVFLRSTAVFTAKCINKIRGPLEDLELQDATK